MARPRVHHSDSSRRQYGDLSASGNSRIQQGDIINNYYFLVTQPPAQPDSRLGSHSSPNESTLPVLGGSIDVNALATSARSLTLLTEKQAFPVSNTPGILSRGRANTQKIHTDPYYISPRERSPPAPASGLGPPRVTFVKGEAQQTVNSWLTNFQKNRAGENEPEDYMAANTQQNAQRPTMAGPAQTPQRKSGGASDPQRHLTNLLLKFVQFSTSRYAALASFCANNPSIFDEDLRRLEATAEAYLSQGNDNAAERAAHRYLLLKECLTRNNKLALLKALSTSARGQEALNRSLLGYLREVKKAIPAYSPEDRFDLTTPSDEPVLRHQSGRAT